MHSLDRKIINRLQNGLPLCDRPFEAVARELEIEEAELLERLDSMLADGRLSRFGPMYNADRMGGAFSLCARSIPSGDLDEVVELVNSFPEVAHNYERDHDFNMWFVLATESQDDIQQTIDDIELITGYPVYDFPKQQEYFVGLKFDV